MDVKDGEVTKRLEGNGIRQRRARVCYSYEPQHEDELALKVGDEVVVHGEDEEGWYQATVNGRSGVCPSNFVEPLPDEMVEPLPKTSPVDTIATKDSVSTTKELKEKLNSSLGKPRDGNSLKRHSVLDPLAPTPEAKSAPENKPPEDVKAEKPQKKVLGVGFGDIFAGGQVKLKSAAKTNGDEKVIGPPDHVHKRPASVAITSTEKDKEKAKEQPEVKKDKDNTDLRSEYAKADYDYTAANGDEISFKTGDIIRIITKECEDEGWWRGELNGQSGVFPDNFCTIVPNIEVAAPKRPARATASDKTSIKKDDAKHLEKELSSKEPLKHEEKTVHKKLPDRSSSTEKPSSPQVKPDRPEKPEKPGAKPAVGKKPIGSPLTKSGEDLHSSELKEKDTQEKDVKHHSGGTSAESKYADVEEKKQEEGRVRASSKPTDVEEKKPDEGRVRAGSTEVKMRHTNGHSKDSKLFPHSTDSVKTESVAVGFEGVQTGEKLSRMTRAKGPQRRPPSMIMIRPNSEEEEKTVPNGLDSVEETMTKEDKPKSSVEPDQSGLTKKDSFLKHLDSALGSRPKSPKSHVVPEPPSASSSGLEDQVKSLQEQVKALKDDHAEQFRELQSLLKQQAAKISALEKELDEMKKSTAK